jgi:hypothetical protein
MVTADAPTLPLPDEVLEVPLDGLPEAHVRISFGGGELRIHPAQPGMLVSGTFRGGVIQRRVDRGRIELEPVMDAGRFLTWGPHHWNVGLTAEIPVDLRVDVGANRSTIDLSSLHVRRLDLQTGASETHIRLPERGRTTAHVSCGLASVDIEVPTGVAARINGRIALGSTLVDESRFQQVGSGWMSPDYATALNRVDLSIDGGLGSLRVS